MKCFQKRLKDFFDRNLLQRLIGSNFLSLAGSRELIDPLIRKMVDAHRRASKANRRVKKLRADADPLMRYKVAVGVRRALELRLVVHGPDFGKDRGSNMRLKISASAECRQVKTNRLCCHGASS